MAELWVYKTAGWSESELAEYLADQTVVWLGLKMVAKMAYESVDQMASLLAEWMVVHLVVAKVLRLVALWGSLMVE